MEPYIKSFLSVGQKLPTRTVTGITTGVVINSKVGPLTAKVTSPGEFLTLFTKNKSISKADHSSVHNAFFLSRVSDLVVKRAFTSKSFPLIGINSRGSYYKLNNDSIASKLEDFDITIPSGIDTPDEAMSLFFQIGNVLFYGSEGDNPFETTGAKTRAAKGLSDTQLTSAGLGVSTDWVVHQLNSNLILSNDNYVTNSINPKAILEASAFINENPDFQNKMFCNTDDITLKVWYSDVTDIKESNSLNTTGSDGVSYNMSVPAGATRLPLPTLTDPFFVGTENGGMYDYLKFNITNYVVDTGDGATWDLGVKIISTGDEQVYTFSDNPEKVNSQGTPIYFDYINNLRDDIFIIKNEDSSSLIAENSTYTGVGKDLFFVNLYNDSTLTNNMAVSVASTFNDYEESRIHFYTDAGWYNKPLGSMFESVSASTKSLTCIGIPPSLSDVNLMKSYSSNFNSFYSIVHANGGKDTSVSGFQLPISSSCYYIETVAKNFTRNNKYAPVFSKVNGTISEGNLYHTFTKSDRDKLNDAHINVLVYDNISGVGYINNNLLSDMSGSLVDEDQSIRIINDIQFDIDKLMESFYSRFNRETTRQKVTSTIENYFKTIILSQNYTIDGYKVIVDNVENTDIVIQNNELRVSVYIKLNHSIKYITVTTNVVPTL